MPRLGLVTIIAVMLLTAAAHAERRVALVFGSDNYASIRPLKNAVGDARLIEGVLSSLDFEVQLEPDRNLAQMRRALKLFRDEAKGADVALVYFAGHGAEIAGRNRLLPTDADASTLDALERTTLPLEDVRKIVNEAASVGLIMLDACRNDPFGLAQSGGRSATSLKPEVAARVQPGLGRVGEAKNLLFTFAAAPGATAADGAGGHSPFATALAEHLGTQGLEIRSVMTLVQQDVYDRTRGAQLPYVESGLPKVFFAAPTAQVLPERERLLLAMADLTPDIRNDVERVASDAQMPLAPLYAALIGGDPDAMTAEQRNARLREAADSFVAVRQEMRTMASADPQVAALRDDAEAQLALGAFDTARATLAEAAAIDERSRDALRANFADRTLSLAATLSLSGGAASADLSYRQAIADYEKSIALFDEASILPLPAEQADRRLKILLSLGDLYTKVGDIGSAARTFATLQAHARRRVAENPKDPSIRHDLAASGVKLANARIAQGDLGAAFREFEAARDLFQAVNEETRGSKLDWIGDLARVHDDIGNLLLKRGDLRAADRSYRAGLALKQKLHESDPGDIGWQRDLTITYDELGDLWRITGDWDGARSAYEAGLRIRIDLGNTLPDDPDRQRDLSVSHDKLGDLLREMGETDAAIQSYRTGKAIVVALAARDAGDANLKRDVALSDSKIGNVLRDQGDLAGALKAFETALENAETMAELDSGNAEWQRDLSVALEKVADILVKQKKPRGALTRYMKSFDIMAKLVESDPGNTDWQRDISITLAEIGNIRLAGGDRRGARQALSECLTIRETLVAADPENALWQRDLVIAYADYSRVADDPETVIERALTVARALESTGRLPETQKGMIDYLERRLAKLGASR